MTRTFAVTIAVGCLFTGQLMITSVARAGESVERAPGTWTCLDRLENKAHVGTRIRVITSRDSVIQGAYLGLGSDRSTVRLESAGNADSPREVRIQEIRALKYQTSGHVRMKYALYGLVVGTAGGALLGAIHGGHANSGGGPADFSIAFNVGSGAVFGGLGGLLLGPVASIFVRHDHSVACLGAPAERSKTPTLAASYLVTLSGGERVSATEVRTRSGMLMLLLTDGTSRYVNPASVKLVADKDGNDHTHAALDDERDLK